MSSHQLGRQQLAQIDLGLAAIEGIAFELDDIELQLRQRAPHPVELVLRFDDHFVKSAGHGPHLRFLGQRPKVALPAPVATGCPDPGIEHSSRAKRHVLFQPLDEIVQLRFGLMGLDFVDHLV
jgi:hypothetical protein